MNDTSAVLSILKTNKFIRFVIVGASATLFQFFLLIIFIEFLSMQSVMASASSFTLSAIGNYWLNYRFTFSSQQSHQTTFPKFVISAGIGLAINTLSFSFFILFFHYLFGQISATALTLISNFSLHKFWIYANDHRDDSKK